MELSRVGIDRSLSPELEKAQGLIGFQNLEVWSFQPTVSVFLIIRVLCSLSVHRPSHKPGCCGKTPPKKWCLGFISTEATVSRDMDMTLHTNSSLIFGVPAYGLGNNHGTWRQTRPKDLRDDWRSWGNQEKPS